FNTVSALGNNVAKREEFIATHKQLVKDAAMLKSKAVPNNSYFNRLFGAKLDAEILYLKVAAFFNFGGRMNRAVDTASQNRSFYRSLTCHKVGDAGILQSEYGLQLVKYSTAYHRYQKSGSQKQIPETAFSENVRTVCNKFVQLRLVQDRV